LFAFCENVFCRKSRDLIPLALCARSWTFSWAPSDRFGIARDTDTTFDVFFWLQVTNFNVSLLHSAPNGADHTHIVIFVLRLHPNYFVATSALGCPTYPINASIFSALRLVEIARLFGRLDHVALTDLTHFRIFPRNLEPDFTHYLCEQRKENGNL
jgi:hypothetical protein